MVSLRKVGANGHFAIFDGLEHGLEFGARTLRGRAALGLRGLRVNPALAQGRQLLDLGPPTWETLPNQRLK